MSVHGKQRIPRLRKSVAGLALELLSALAVGPLASGQCRFTVIPITDPGSCFGYDVAIEGDSVAIGDPCISDSLGSVSVRRWDGTGWAPDAMLTASDGADGDALGYSVDMHGDLLVASAINDEDAGPDTGAVYIFERTSGGWIERQKLSPVGLGPAGDFGYSVAVDRSIVAVCAALSDRAFVYERQGATWMHEATFDVDGANSVALSGTTLLVGAGENSQAGQLAGAVFVYEREPAGWTQQAVLTAADATAFDNFGQQIGIDDDVLVAGAPTARGATGSAYVFRRLGGSWTQEAKLLSPAPHPFDRFGGSVSIDGDVLAASSRGYGAEVPQGGLVFVFEHMAGTWTAVDRIRPKTTTAAENFGWSLALQGRELAIGCWIFGDEVDIVSSTPEPASYCASVPNSSGRKGRIDFAGSESLAADSAALVATGCPPLEWGIFFLGDTPDQAPFGNGFLCVAPGGSGLGRIHPAVAIDASGSATLDLDFDVLPARAIEMGSTWHFQLWFHDGATFGTTDGVRVTFCR